MNSNLSHKLVEAFPDLFHPDFDFECNDGWFDLIWSLCEKINPLIDASEPDPDFGYTQATQVKQKLGGLRFYISHGSDELFDIISKAEAKSFSICESCGKPGKLRSGNWMGTLCEDHHKSRKKR